jgi:murein DD-endopeptidase MepM/ murein hydrolase activator NlpD
LLSASVGVPRVLKRLRPTTSSRKSAPIRFHGRSVHATGDQHVPAASLGSTAPASPRLVAKGGTGAFASRLRGRVGPEAAIPVAAAVIVLLASVLSWLPGSPAHGAVGGTTGDGSGPRIAVGGITAGDLVVAPDGVEPADSSGPDAPVDALVDAPVYGSGGSFPTVDLTRIDTDATAAARAEAAQANPKAEIRGPFLADGTLLKPIAVDTSIADGKGLLKVYKVRAGDTLTAIANRFGVSAMTIWWANDLKSKRLAVGRDLTIPPMNGLVVTAREGDTLETLAAANKITADLIYETNGLEDRNLVVGQTLVLPGAVGEALPKPRQIVKPTRSTTGSTIRPPATYTGGAFLWPVVGGSNYISQYFHYGHYGLDIAADYGSRVRAAGAGIVIFAGWKSNGGGYQVWIAHGSGLYTTYNHMSAVNVAGGQSVAQGQQVGRIGQSGWATGPHLHFEVWRGEVWNGGTRVNPLIYLSS